MKTFNIFFPQQVEIRFRFVFRNPSKATSIVAQKKGASAKDFVARAPYPSLHILRQAPPQLPKPRKQPWEEPNVIRGNLGITSRPLIYENFKIPLEITIQ